MNKLSYGLLSLLAVETLTGYELTQKINQFWHTNHSAVYPLLSELETRGSVSFKLIEQNGKPDKKIFAITDQGMLELKKWVVADLRPALKKDEMALKLFCMESLDSATIDILLKKIETRCSKKINQRRESLENLKNKLDGKLDSFNSPKIGSFLLIQKSLSEAKIELAWCKWIRELNDKGENVNLFDYAFTYDCRVTDDK